MAQPIVLPVSEYSRYFREKLMYSPFSICTGDAVNYIKSAIMQAMKGDSDNIIFCGHVYESLYQVVQEVRNRLEEDHWQDYRYLEFRADILVNDFSRTARTICQCPNGDHFCFTLDNIKGETSSEFFNLIKSFEMPEEKKLPLVILISGFEYFLNDNPSIMYNLFSLTKYCTTMPILVIGLTTVFDPSALFEKRIRSRFSHRAFILKEVWDSSTRYEEFFSVIMFKNMKKEGALTRGDKAVWNRAVRNLLSQVKECRAFREVLYMYPSHRLMRTLLCMLINWLSPNRHILTYDDFNRALNMIIKDPTVFYMKQLPATHLAMIVAILMTSEQHSATRGVRFMQMYHMFCENVKGASLTAPSMKYLRQIVLQLEDAEYLIPRHIGLKTNCSKHNQQVYDLAYTRDQVETALALAPNLPVFLQKWAKARI